jgi:AGZA family xanthine/uracil permease-like MFS transporter
LFWQRIARAIELVSWRVLPVDGQRALATFIDESSRFQLETSLKQSSVGMTRPPYASTAIPDKRNELEYSAMTSIATSAPPGFKPRLWVPGDWNAFFGFGTNILVNLLTLTGLLRFVLQMPADLVFKRILPATGLMMCMSTMYYASLAYRLAKKTGRKDVCALPSGISVPHMFIVTLVIMLPVKIVTGDPIKGWQAGLTWVFIQSFVLMAGGFLAPIVRRITPKAALLGALAGVSITFISMKPALEMFMTPVIGIVCFAIILVSWFGGMKYSGIPAGLVAIAAGTLIAWGSNLFGLHFGNMSAENVKASFQTFDFAVPYPAIGLVLGGLHWSFLKTILVTAIPFGIYDLVEAMDNVVSASAAGDEYPTTRVLTADGVVSLIGCLMGNPYINAVYIGHPGWKAMGGRIGYSAATGIMVIVLSWFGVISLMTAVVPIVAISPILLYIGMLIGSQAFQESPHRHAPAIVVALIPSIAAWGKLQIDNTLGAVSNIHQVTPDMIASMKQVGVMYQGLAILGAGSILSGVVLGAVTTYIVERNFSRAAAFAAGGGVLTCFGLMHGEEVDLSRIQNPGVVAAYLLVSGLLLVCHRFAVVGAPAEDHGAHAISEHEKDALAPAE